MAIQLKADELVAKPFVVGLFRKNLQAYLKQGMDEAKAREYAATEAFGVVERAQQSGHEHNRHHLVRSSAWARLLTTFRTTPVQMLQYEAKAWADYLRGEEGAGRKLIATMVINHVLSPLALSLIDAFFNGVLLGGFFSDDDEKREKLAKRLAWQLLAESIFGPIAAIPIIGGVTSWVMDFFQSGKESALSAYNLRPKLMEVPVVNTAANALSYGGELLHDLATLDFGEMVQDMEDILHENVAPYRQIKTAMENWTDEDWDEFLEEEFPKK
jgi:hypothetical protein